MRAKFKRMDYTLSEIFIGALDSHLQHILDVLESFLVPDHRTSIKANKDMYGSFKEED